MTGKDEAPRDEALRTIEADLAASGFPCVAESFRIPAAPGLSPAAGFLVSAGGGFALAAGRPGLAFLLGVAGAAILLLDASGFAPLDWIGPKRRSRVLVLPGPPTREPREAFFLGIPLACSSWPAPAGRGPGWNRYAYPAGVALAGIVALLSGAAALAFASLAPAVGIAGGAGLVVPAAAAAVSGRRGGGPSRNRAARWVTGMAAALEGPSRPTLFVYPGDPAEAKFFLARYREPLFGGRGLFLEFPEGAGGPFSVGRAEGPLVPHGVDPLLFDAIRRAAKAAGLPEPAGRKVRRKTAALCAMARGFRAATVGQEAGPVPGVAAPTAEPGFRWVLEIAKAAGNPIGLTGGGEGV